MGRLTRRALLARLAPAAISAVALTSFGPAAPSVPPSPVEPPVATGPVDPRVGVHTRLTDEPAVSRIARTLEMVRAMGAGSFVEYFPWAYFQPGEDRWDWSHGDTVVGEAQRQGLRLYARIDYVPAWARPTTSSSRLLPDAALPAYAAALAAFARRYQERLAGIVVWNEPNTSFEWGFRPVDPAGYTRLLKAAYVAVKEASPGTRVLAAGLAPTLEKSPQNLDDLDYLSALYENGASRWFDGLAAHAYGWQAPPEQAPSPERINFRRVELQRAIMVQNGDAAKPIVLTETGWNDQPRWTKAVSPADRILYTIRALSLAAASWPWLESANFWLFRLPVLAHNYNDGYAFVTPDFQPLPIYDAVRSYVRSEVTGTPLALPIPGAVAG